MEMTTGIDWFEHEDKGMDETSSMLMLYGPGVRNTLDFALSLPMAYKPGRAWNYSSGNTVILAGLLSAMYGEDYQKKLLFRDLHMEKAYVEKDFSKNTVGSSFSYLTPLDMLKLGELYLNKGCLKKVSGKCSEQDQFFPPGWTDYVQTLISAYNNPETDAAYVKKEMMVYGTSFAVNKGVPSRGIPQPFPEAPADMYFAAGHFGQLIIILPGDKTIIVRTAYDETYWKHVGKMAKLTLECFKDNKVKTL
jgi:CubicO group peptidase (beta-lactamase class C family)